LWIHLFEICKNQSSETVFPCKKYLFWCIRTHPIFIFAWILILLRFRFLFSHGFWFCSGSDFYFYTERSFHEFQNWNVCRYHFLSWKHSFWTLILQMIKRWIHKTFYFKTK
jgi:hypothetical protein